MTDNQNLEAERAAMLAAYPSMANVSDPVLLHAALTGWLAARRSAAGSFGGVELPPLPEPVDEVRAMFRGEMDYARPGDNYYTAEQVRQAQHEAVEADRQARGQGNTQKVHIAPGQQPAPAASIDMPKPWHERMTEYYSAAGSKPIRSTEFFKDAEIEDWCAWAKAVIAKLTSATVDAERYRKIRAKVEDDYLSFRKMSADRFDKIVDNVLSIPGNGDT